jgi:hypothetical protein
MKHIYKTIYSLEKFCNDFKDVDFDRLLIEQNNSLVNSSQHYLDLKNAYIKETNGNFNILSNTLVEFNVLINNYKKHEQGNVIRHHYNVVDKSKLELLNNQIKEIFENQRKIFVIFTNYINFLNDAQTKTSNGF